MPRKSSITRLDPRIREAVDAAIREGRLTIEELVDLVNTQGGRISPSAMGRYRQTAEAQMARYREAQEVAKVWIGKLEADPNGDIGRLLPEMLRMVAFQQLADIDEETGITPKDLDLLSRAIKNAAGASKTSVEVERLRRQIIDAAKSVETIENEVRSGERKLDADTLKRIREVIYGIV